MINQIKNSIYVKHVALVLVFCTLFMSFKSKDGGVILQSGTNLSLETVNAIMSISALPGQSVDFRVRQDIIVGEKVVIAAGSIAKGQIMRAQKAKALGKQGFIEVQIKSVTAADGQEVMLSGSNLFNEGEDKETTALVLGLILCILFLTMKGEEGIIPAGYQFNANVATTMTINI